MLSSADVLLDNSVLQGAMRCVLVVVALLATAACGSANKLRVTVDVEAVGKFLLPVATNGTVADNLLPQLNRWVARGFASLLSSFALHFVPTHACLPHNRVTQCLLAVYNVPLHTGIVAWGWAGFCAKLWCVVSTQACVYSSRAQRRCAHLGA